MKYFVLAFCSLFSQALFAQTANTLWFPSQHVSVKNEMEVLQFLHSTFQEINIDDLSLQLHFQSKASASNHYEFELVYKQIKLLNSTIKVNTDIQGNILSIKKEVEPLDVLQDYDPSNEIAIWNQVDIKKMSLNFWDPLYSITSSEYKIQLHNSKPRVVLELNSWNKTHDNTLILAIDGTQVAAYDNARHFNQDTVVHVRIFNPDPLTTLGLNYGGTYIDNNDVNDSWMNTAYVDTMVRATFDNSTNTFYLENPYVMIDELELPAIPPVTSSTPYFIFDRSQSGFEDANACYHITTFHDYISSIGYDTLMNLQLLVDTHAENGADNSVFLQNGGNPEIMYGTGGVDDAEDADVIIHEYSHGLSWSANHNTTLGFDRSAIDEGLADYFATSYSRSINPFSWEHVFSWDGPIWGGRIANSAFNYPLATPNYYKVGEIWNSAMSAIWTDLGQVVTDKLMLESMHFFTNNTMLPEAAMYVLQSDTVLFGGIHTASICTQFQARTILDASCNQVGIKNIITNKLIQLVNTLAFSNRSGEAILKFPSTSEGHYEIYNLYGQLIFSQSFKNQDSVSISSKDLISGIYILKVSNGKGLKNFTLSVN